MRKGVSMEENLEQIKRTAAMDRLLVRYRRSVTRIMETEQLASNCAMLRLFIEGFVDPFAVEVAYDEIYRLYDTIGTSKGKALHDTLFATAALLFTVKKMVTK